MNYCIVVLALLRCQQVCLLRESTLVDVCTVLVNNKFHSQQALDPSCTDFTLCFKYTIGYLRIPKEALN